MNIVHACALGYFFVLNKAQTNDLTIRKRQMKISQDVLANKFPKRKEIHSPLRQSTTNSAVRKICYLNQEASISNVFNSSRNKTTYM